MAPNRLHVFTKGVAEETGTAEGVTRITVATANGRRRTITVAVEGMATIGITTTGAPAIEEEDRGDRAAVRDTTGAASMTGEAAFLYHLEDSHI